MDPRLQSALTFPTLVRGGDVAPVWAPDGRTFAFIEGDAVVVVDPDTGRARRLLEGTGLEALRWIAPETLEVDRDGKTLLVGAIDGRTRPLPAGERERREVASPRVLR